MTGNRYILDYLQNPGPDLAPLRLATGALAAGSGANEAEWQLEDLGALQAINLKPSAYNASTGVWTDVSGKGANASQASGINRPAANGSGGVVLTSTTWLDIAGLPADDPDQSLFVLMQVTSLSGEQTIFGGDDAGHGRQLKVNAAGGITYLAGGLAQYGQSPDGLIAANTDVLIGFIPKSSPSGGNQHELWINGAFYAIGSAAATGLTAGSTSRIGRRDGAEEPMTGIVYQVFGLIGNPSDAAILQKIFGRIAWNNAKTNLLSTDHPYKTTPPLR
jgi:hypothetical protein